MRQFLRYSSMNPYVFSSPPKHSFGRLWITCTHPSCLNCSNMLEVDQTERLWQRAADRASPVGCWGGSDMKTGGKNKGLSGLLKMPGPRQPIRIHSVKQAWNTRQLQEALKHSKLTVCQKIRCQNGEMLAYETHFTRSDFLKHKPVNIFSCFFMNTSQTFSHNRRFNLLDQVLRKAAQVNIFHSLHVRWKE